MSSRPTAQERGGRPLWAVLPGGIDDPAAPSGGNRYDRKVLDILSGAHRDPPSPYFQEVGPAGAAVAPAPSPNFQETGPPSSENRSTPPNFQETGPTHPTDNAAPTPNFQETGPSSAKTHSTPPNFQETGPSGAADNPAPTPNFREVGPSGAADNPAPTPNFREVGPSSAKTHSTPLNFQEIGPSGAAVTPNFLEVGLSGAADHPPPPDILEVGLSGGNLSPTSWEVGELRGDEAGPCARDVHEVAINGSWPVPDAAARADLQAALTDIPDKSDVLLDGLVACGVPEILEPHAHRLRLIVLVHLPLSDETGLPAADAAALRERERRALHLADTVVATSDAAAERITAMHGLARVAVAAPGVDPAPPAAPSPTGRRMLCVASVTARKGQDLLVRVLEDDLAELDWTCTFVGALAQPVAYSDERIRFAGPLTGGALDDAYAKADLFVLPSRAETYGMVVTEALARALPVIATDVGGVSEALGTVPGYSQPGNSEPGNSQPGNSQPGNSQPGNSQPGNSVTGSSVTGSSVTGSSVTGATVPGRLVPPDDPAALAAALRAWLTDPGLRERWRTAAHARRGTLSTWTGTARRLAAILDRSNELDRSNKRDQSDEGEHA